MRNIWTIVRKELARVFTDRRVIFSLFILPPLTIYLIYGLMGMSAENETKKAEEYTAIVYVVDAPESITGSLGTAEDFNDFIKDKLTIKATIHNIKSNTLEESIQLLKDEKIDLIIEFPSDFEEQVSGSILPEIKLHHNINRQYSQTAYYSFLNTISEYSTEIAGTRVDLSQLNVFEVEESPVGDETKQKGSILAQLLPLLLVIYLMAGAMGIGIESVAGEKERGTIATLLVTPIKRSQLAIGKIISIAIIAVLSSIASFLGLLAVLPTFAKIGDGAGMEGVNYNLTSYGMILSVMLMAVLLFVALIVIVSTYSKTVKEAGTLVMPIYLIVMGAAFFNMFTLEITQSVTAYCIPIYNIVVALKAIFSFEMSTINWIATIGSTAIYTLLLIFVIQKMFRSEKIMFNK